MLHNPYTNHSHTPMTFHHWSSFVCRCCEQQLWRLLLVLFPHNVSIYASEGRHHISEVTSALWYGQHKNVKGQRIFWLPHIERLLRAISKVLLLNSYSPSLSPAYVFLFFVPPSPPSLSSLPSPPSPNIHSCGWSPTFGLLLKHDWSFPLVYCITSSFRWSIVCSVAISYFIFPILPILALYTPSSPYGSSSLCNVVTPPSSPSSPLLHVWVEWLT